MPATYVLVGEAPGHQEIDQGRGFVGASGKLLWNMLERVGVPPREDGPIWVTNAALCLERKVKLSTGAYLGSNQVKSMAAHACRRRLLWEIHYVTQGNPNAVVIPIGNWALWSLTDLKNPKIYSYRGSVMNVDLQRLAART